MSIHIQGYGKIRGSDGVVRSEETGDLHVGYRAFKNLRDGLLEAAPLDFRLEHQLWWESAWDANGMLREGPYIDYEDFPDWDATPMRARLWEFCGHSDCGGSWEDPRGTAELLRILEGRLPDGSPVDRKLLGLIIELFACSDEVEFL